MNSRKQEFQARWNTLTGTNFDKALILLCNYAGIELNTGKVSSTLTSLQFSDEEKEYAQHIKASIEFLFKHYGNQNFLTKKGLFCIVPVLLSIVKKAAPTLNPNETLGELVSIISQNSELDYELISADELDEIVSTWLLPRNSWNASSTFQKTKELLSKNTEIIKSRFADELEKLVQVLKSIDRTVNHNLILICIVEHPAFSSALIDGAISEIIYRKFIDIFASAIVSNDNDLKKQLLQREDVVDGLKQDPYYFLLAILNKNGNPSDATTCITIFKQIGLIPENITEKSKMHPQNFLDFLNLDRSACPELLNFLNDNITFAEPILFAIIQSKESAYQACKKIGDYPNLHRFITSRFDLDLNEIFAHAMSGYYTGIIELFTIYPKNTFNVSKQDSETGDTYLHNADKRVYKNYAGKAEIIMTVNRHLLFTTNNQGELPNLPRHIDFENCWKIAKTFMCVPDLPQEILSIIALKTAQAYCGNALTPILKPEERNACLKHR